MTERQIPDFDGIADALGDGGAHDEMREMFLKLVDLLNQRQALEEQMSALSKEINRLQWSDLPALMREAGFGDDDMLRLGGYEMTKKKVLTVSGKRATGSKEEQLAWLAEHGHGGLIKNTVSVGFAPNETGKAAELLLELRDRFDTTKRERKVESASLKSTISQNLRDLEAGREVTPIPLELFGAENRETAEIKPVKKRS